MYSQTNRPRRNAQSPQYLLPQASPTSPSSAYNSARADTWNSPTVMARPSLHSAANSQPLLSGHRGSASYNGPIGFPVPQLYRSVSERPVPPALTPSKGRSTHTLRPPGLHRGPPSTASSYYHPHKDQTPDEVRSQRTFPMPEFISTLVPLQGCLQANLE